MIRTFVDRVAGWKQTCTATLVSAQVERAHDAMAVRMELQERYAQ